MNTTELQDVTTRRENSRVHLANLVDGQWQVLCGIKSHLVGRPLQAQRRNLDCPKCLAAREH